MTRRQTLAACLAALGFGPAWHAVPTRARPANDQWQQAVNLAALTVARLRRAAGRRFPGLIKSTTAILIAPNGNRADSLLLIRHDTGWGEPAFLSGSGLTTARPTILLIRTERALDEILHQRGLTLSGPAELTLAHITSRVPADILAWPGPDLSPDGFLQDDAANAAWYGLPRTAPEIVGATPPDLRTSKLRAELSRK